MQTKEQSCTNWPTHDPCSTFAHQNNTLKYLSQSNAWVLYWKTQHNNYITKHIALTKKTATKDELTKAVNCIIKYILVGMIDWTESVISKCIDGHGIWIISHKSSDKNMLLMTYCALQYMTYMCSYAYSKRVWINLNFPLSHLFTQCIL